MCAVRKYSVSDANMRLPEFTKRFRQLVDEYGGVSKLADNSKISRTTINFWYNGERTPDAERLIILHNTLNISIDYLLGLKKYRTYAPDLNAACEYSQLSQQSLTGIHDFLRKVPLSLNFIDKFIQYCCLHGKILQMVMYAAESNKHVHNNIDFKVNSYFFAQSLKKIFCATGEGSVKLPDGAVPLPADDARDFFIDQATRYFREFLTDFIKQSSVEAEEEENNG